ncbi:MAG TPA: hypothetical protein VM286_06595 [Candidatus Thermoplasmatota archaeon]|nr:hypothetical protein [Candidatus Thermoplasmatota archaeon]
MTPPRTHRLTLLLVACAMVAGCLKPAAEPLPDPALVVPTSFVAKGPAVGPDLNATTAAAPRLVEGEWWRIKFGSQWIAAQDVELLRVVANATEEGYVFGMPHGAWLKEAISFHAPAFGDIGRDLSYAVHNERFTPLKFPLVAGATWTTDFGPLSGLTATVESADQHTAEIVLRSPPAETSATNNPATDLLGLTGGDGVALRLTYDARIHEVTHLESGLGSWDVIEHGYQFRGWVSVPKGEHTAIDYGVFGPDQGNPLPTRTVHVDESFNRITVMHFIMGISPGLYRITSTTPKGEKFVTEHQGAAGQQVAFFEVGDPGGDWTQEDLGVGAGATYTMGIAYQQYDILVPEGDRRPTHGHEVVR